MLEYTLLRGKRKTLTIYVRVGGKVEVRAPHQASLASIERFISEKERWIHKTKLRIDAENANKRVIRLTAQQKLNLTRELCEYLEMRTPQIAALAGVSYGKIRVGNAEKRWGSCTADGKLTFTWRLALLPEDVIDYVIAHELCHRREMNHSPRFWELVGQLIPDYREKRGALKLFSRDSRIILEN
jgi:predicted metal-dependent hydrolase